MNNLVKCPNCASEFPIDQAMSAQLEARIRGDLQAEYSQKTQGLVAERDKLAGQQRQLEAQQEQFDEQVSAAVAKKCKTIETKAKVVAQQAVAVDIRDRDEQLQELKKEIETFEDNELELRREKRELEEQKRQQELKVTRQLDEERQSIRAAVTKEAQEQNALKLAEADLKNRGLVKQIEELKQKAEQGSQQIQGEVQELALENLLPELFPGDVVEPIAKGVKGGDVLQHVFDHNDRECGTILWESKRTKHWSDKWLGKVLDDQQDAKASCACIVTAAMPESVEYFGEIGDVWVANFSCARSVAIAMRRVLIETAQARRATEGQQGKMEIVYNYLSGPEFRNRVRGLIEPFIEMQADLETQKRAFQRQWNKQYKQLDRALASTTGLYGDLQGIIGAGLQEIEGMDLLALEAANESDDGVTST